MPVSMTLPGFTASRAIWPVWRDSACKPVRFVPMAKKAAVRLFHELRRFERQTRQPGHQNGALGRNGLAVAHALIFDFLNFRTGRLDPSARAIAAAACISERSVWRGIAALKAAGVLHAVRRCVEVILEDGRFELRQETNAYSFRPPTQWRGHAPTEPSPAPTPDAWGAAPPLTDALTRAAQEAAGGLPAMVAALRSDPVDRLAAALGRLGGLMARKPLDLPDCQIGKETDLHPILKGLGKPHAGRIQTSPDCDGILF